MAAAAEITERVAEQDQEGAVTATLAVTPIPRASLEQIFQTTEQLGASEYFELAYSKTYGETTQDIIYKVAFESRFLFIRYLFHKKGDAWTLWNIKLQTEGSLPLPEAWVHIYPD